jgi:hypothetical protein
MTEHNIATAFQRHVENLRVGRDRAWQIAGIEQESHVVGLNQRTEAPLGLRPSISRNLRAQEP